MPKDKTAGSSLINSAMILVTATVIVKVIGAIYKIPLTSIIGGVGRGYFSTAYNIYTPIYAISMAGLPTAVSKMVSEHMALENYGTVQSIKRVAVKLFCLTGILGTIVLIATAYPYGKFVAGTIGVVPCIITIAPSIFFCCLMSAYRGYYEGQQNMKPTAISQVIEAVSKLVFGLALSYWFLNYCLNEFHTSGTVFGKAAESLEQAMSMIYPYSAAVSVLGVSIGTIFGCFYMFFVRPKNSRLIQKEPSTLTDRQIVKLMVTIAVPVVAGSLIQNISNLIDTAMIQSRLEHAIAVDGYSLIQKMYAQSFAISGTVAEDVKTYLFGVYNSALDFKNLIPTVTLAIGISALPTMSRAWTLGNSAQVENILNNAVKFSMIIGLPIGFGMAAVPDQLLYLVYGGSNPDIIPIASSIVRSYGASMILFAASGPLISMLQAIGRADVTIQSMAAGAVVKIILNYILIGNPAYNIKGAPVSTICCYVIIVLWNLFALLRESKVRLDVVSCVIKPLVAGLACGASAFFGYDFAVRWMSQNLATVVSVSAAALIYLILLFSLSIITKNDIKFLYKSEKKA